ncbi:MAG: hypothetical protein Q9160_007508 [Pyrenula sp. 1 TL-2023]
MAVMKKLMTTAFLHRRVSLLDVFKIWFISFSGNLAGSLFFVAISAGYYGIFTSAPAYTQETLHFATQIAAELAWHQIFIRAIGANWLVHFDVFISISSRE